MSVRSVHGEWLLEMKAFNSLTLSKTCVPRLILNGARAAATFDQLVSSISRDDLIGVEVYTREIQAPESYPRDPVYSCGLVAIWTRQ